MYIHAYVLVPVVTSIVCMYIPSDDAKRKSSADQIRELLYHLITSNQMLGFLLTVICASTVSGSSVCTK